MTKITMPTLKVPHRLYAGFAFIVFLLATAVSVSLWEVNILGSVSHRIKMQRMPSAAATAGLTANVDAALASLRGWMLTGSNKFKDERAAVWREIDNNNREIDGLSANWANSRSVAEWTEIKLVLKEFKDAQDKVEAIANSVDEQPANKILVEEAAPRGAIMSEAITKIIDLELAGGNNAARAGDRLQLLGIMADIRGTLGLGLANIRAYLLTGQTEFVDKFNTLWAKNDRRFSDLKKASNLLSVAQKEAFKDFSESRVQFAPLPSKMFAIRSSDKWNMANYLLITEAAPRAEKILSILLGAKQKDGSYAGGMREDQVNLLGKDTDLMMGELTLLSTVLKLILGISIAAGGLIAFFTSRSIATPLVDMAQSMSSLANGNLEVEVPAQGRKDEIGDMSNAVQVFKDNAIRNKELEAGQAEQNRRLEDEKRQMMNNLADDFDTNVGMIINSVSSASTELIATAQTMTGISNETSSRANAVAAASEEASTNVQTVASATEEMSASISQINGQVAQASNASQQAVAGIEKSAIQMKNLAQTADKIGEVISMISDIAEQTNLLALNATIESARAGDAGKGFAVVASEVKALASETAKATEDISRHIEDIQLATGEAVASIDDIGKIIKQVDEASTAIAAAMEEQGATTQEVAQNVAEAASGTQEVSANISGVTQASQEVGAASEEVTTAAEELSMQSDMMKTEVKKFIEQVRVS